MRQTEACRAGFRRTPWMDAVLRLGVGVRQVMAGLAGAGRCAVCGGWWAPEPGADLGLCPSCWQPLVFCDPNADLTSGRALRHLSFLAAVLAYEGPGREYIQAMKYRGRVQIGEALGLLQSAWVDLYPELWRSDCVVSVPLAPWRAWERGFNQADLLAAPVARRLRVPFLAGVLRRGQETERQAGLSRWERRRNVEGVFHLSPGWQARLAGAEVLLVDDIVTTGATLDACAATLKQAGAAGVRAFVLAHASLRRTTVGTEAEQSRS